MSSFLSFASCPKNLASWNVYVDPLDLARTREHPKARFQTEVILLQGRCFSVCKSKVNRERPIGEPVHDRHLADGKRQRTWQQLDQLLCTGHVKVCEFGRALKKLSSA